MNLRRFALLLALAGSASPAPPQSPLLCAGFEDMYNLRFDAAHKAFRTYEQQNPNDPLGPVSDGAAFLFSEFNRLGVLQSQFLTSNNEFLNNKRLPENAQVAKQFEEALSRTDTLAAAALKTSQNDPGALLAQAIRLGLHADYLALIQKRELAALTEVKQGTQVAEQLLSEHPDYYDAHIAKGVENYLLSLKPAPVRWLLRATGAQTDREAGIAELRITAAHGQYLAPYAKVLLAVAALRANRPSEAKSLLTDLAAHYPGNVLYQNELAKLK